MAESLEDLDSQGARELRRELVRGSRPTQRSGPATVPTAPSAPAPRPAPPHTPQQSGSRLQVTADGTKALRQPFVVVDEPPEGGRRGRKAPAERIALIDFLRQYPGTWVKYTPADDTAKPAAIADAARKGKSGFGPGFDARAVDGVAFVMFRGEPDAVGDA